MILLHWLLDNGIGQNVVASALFAVPTILFGWRKVLPRLREHERKVLEIHEHLRRHDHVPR